MAEAAGKQARIFPVLIGLMGSGKSIVGRQLAKYLDLPMIDLDSYIVEKVKKTIPEIFAEQGEEVFRNLESEALQEVLGRPAVVATGGGVVIREENRELLKKHPPVIWLKTAAELLAERIDGDSNRPLIADGETLQKLQKLAEARDPLYEECADFTLPHGNLEEHEVLQEVLLFLTEWKAANQL